jgi:hypothetical protein
MTPLILCNRINPEAKNSKFIGFPRLARATLSDLKLLSELSLNRSVFNPE